MFKQIHIVGHHRMIVGDMLVICAIVHLLGSCILFCWVFLWHALAALDGSAGSVQEWILQWTPLLGLS